MIRFIVILCLSVGVRAETVTWNNSPNVTWEVQWNGSIYPVTSNSFNLGRLAKKKTYTVSVRAVNSAGKSPWSTYSWTKK